MSKVQVRNGEQVNELELIQVVKYMEDRFPNLPSYTVAPGNECLWVYWGSSLPMNLYFIFRNGSIADIQID